MQQILNRVSSYNRIILIAILSFLVIGCSITRQDAWENRYDENGNLVGEIHTKTAVKTYIASQQKAKAIKSSNTEDAQNVEIADINQESDVASVVKATMEGLAPIIGEMVKSAIEGASPVE